MLLFWGILGVLQGVFLPGAALCAFAAPRDAGALKFISAAFIFSLLLNYAAAFLLIGLGLYTREVLIGLACGSLALLAAGLIRRPYTPAAAAGGSAPPASPAVRLLFAAAFAVALLAAATFEQGRIFRHIDAILSWNAWAQSWAANLYPRTFGDYPQLMPIIMGLPYIFMGGDELELFSILSLNLFLPFGLSALYTLRAGPWAPAAAAGALGLTWLSLVTKPGYADVVVAAPAFMALAALRWSIEAPRGGGGRFHLYTAFGGAAACAVLKQGGLFWLPWFCLIAAEGLAGAGHGRRLKTLAPPAALAFAIALPWYIYNKYLIYIGQVPPMINFFLSEPALYHGRSFMGRAVYAAFRYSYYTVFALAAWQGLRRPGFRALGASSLFLMGAWALFFSYGAANVKFPVALAFWPLGPWLSQWAASGRPERLWAAARSFGAALGENRLKLGLGLLAGLWAVCFLASPRIDAALNKARREDGLAIGPGGISWRLGYLERKNPQPVLAVHDRLRQLADIPEFRSFSPDAEIASFGYLVLDGETEGLVDKKILRENFQRDHEEEGTAIFIRKDLLDAPD